jgi:hypothetical protein
MIGWVRVLFNERDSDGLAEKAMQEEPWDHFLQSYETGWLFLLCMERNSLKWWFASRHNEGIPHTGFRLVGPPIHYYL